MNPIEVSTERPPLIAAAEAPLPRWNATIVTAAWFEAGQRGIAGDHGLVREAVEPEAADAVPLASSCGIPYV